MKTIILSSLLTYLALPVVADVPRKKPLSRYTKLWNGNTTSMFLPTSVKPEADRVKELEKEVAELKARIEQFEKRFERKKKRRAEKAQKQEVEVPEELADWLEKFDPEPINFRQAMVGLEQLVSKQGKAMKLPIQRIAVMQAVPGKRYSRSRLECQVSGDEKTIYKWLDALQSPNDFRVLTALRVKQNQENPGKIDCLVRIEQWFRDADQENPPAAVSPESIVDLQGLLLSEYYPLELLHQVVAAKPKEKLVLVRTDIDLFPGGDSLRPSIRVQGISDALDGYLNFGENLKASKALKGHKWFLPPPSQTKDRRWSFTYEGH